MQKPRVSRGWQDFEYRISRLPLYYLIELQSIAKTATNTRPFATHVSHSDEQTFHDNELVAVSLGTYVYRMPLLWLSNGPSHREYPNVAPERREQITEHDRIDVTD